MPGNFGAPRHFVDPQPRAFKNLGERQPAFTHHLGQSLRVRSIRALPLGGDRARGGVKSDQRARLRFHQRQTSRKRLARPREGIHSCGIKNHNARLQT
jgi:hypothetical protein